MSRKVVILQNVLAPYRKDLFNRLSELEGCDLQVLFLFSSLKNLQWEMDEATSNARFNYAVIEPRVIDVKGKKYHLGVELFRNLKSHKPDLIISGELGINTITSLIYAKLNQIPLVAWWAGSSQTEKDISWFKKIVRGALVRQIDQFIVYSQAARQYLIQFGVRQKDIYVAGNVTFDASDYRARVDRERLEAVKWRQTAGIDEGSLILLSVGALVPRKNHMMLLDAIGKMPDLVRQSIWVLVVGDGPLRNHLEDKARLVGVNAFFVGHIKPEKLCLYYAIADIFVHLTLKDHWSQVVNEAMASGLPVIVSKYDHAIQLIEHETDGFVVDPSDFENILELLEDLVKHPNSLSGMGEAAHRKISQFDISYSYNVFRKVILGNSSARLL
jgi:glycosyltransferase involved in cell wall biosynthesis